MEIETYRQLQTWATQLSRTSADAEDLVQETLLAALQAGRAELPWLHGVMGNLAMMQARTAGRRRKREAVVANQSPATIDTAPVTRDPVVPDWIMQLPPSARRVAVLALHGLSAQEIRCVLDIGPAAFRQRLSRIRRGLETLSPALRAECADLADASDPYRSVDLQFGLVRRALKAALRGRGLGTHDLDGHLLVVATAARSAFTPRIPIKPV
ncbi:MAG: RNA polymerase sigma factor [Pseudoxanthomonas sp.]